MRKPEPVQIIKERRDAALKRLVNSIPYVEFLGIEFARRGDELTSELKYNDMLIGNPTLPALHGGVTGAFLEVTAQIVLSWSIIWPIIEEGGKTASDIEDGKFPSFPKTIDFTIDYLRSGLPRDAYARAIVNRSGRRYASVDVEGWQDNRSRPFVKATGHFLMPN